MQLTLFWIFSIIMTIFGVGVITLRNPVSCAMSLVGCFIALAALFITSDVKMIGMTLFHSFNLPFQIVGILLLAATIGVVVLSRRTLR